MFTVESKALIKQQQALSYRSSANASKPFYDSKCNEILVEAICQSEKNLHTDAADVKQYRTTC
jgi:hypothetical protein